MLDVSTIRHPNYQQNKSRQRNDTEPCLICGKHILGAGTAKYVRLHNHGDSIVTEAEAATLRPDADMGCFPVGAGCIRQHPELKPYICN